MFTSIPTPPDRLVCEPAGDRPTIPPGYTIDWSRVTTVDQARQEHQRYVGTVLDREARVAHYIVEIEGRLFTCASNMQWRRDFEAGLPRP